MDSDLCAFAVKNLQWHVEVDAWNHVLIYYAATHTSYEEVALGS